MSERMDFIIPGPETAPLQDFIGEYFDVIAAADEARYAETFFTSMTTFQRSQEKTARLQERQALWKEWQDVATIVQPDWVWPDPEYTDGGVQLRDPRQSFMIDYGRDNRTRPLRLDLTYQLDDPTSLRLWKHTLPISKEADNRFEALLWKVASTFIVDGMVINISPPDTAHEEAERMRKEKLEQYRQAAVPIGVRYSLSRAQDLSQEVADEDIIVQGRLGINDPAATKFDGIDIERAFCELFETPDGVQRYRARQTPGQLIELFGAEFAEIDDAIRFIDIKDRSVLQMLRSSNVYQRNAAAINARLGTGQRQAAA